MSATVQHSTGYLHDRDRIRDTPRAALEQADEPEPLAKRARDELKDAPERLVITHTALDALGDREGLDDELVLAEVPSRPAATPAGRWTLSLPELTEIARRLNLTPAVTPRELEGISDGIGESIVGVSADSSSAVLVLAADEEGQERNQVIAVRSGSQPLALLLACSDELARRCRATADNLDPISAQLDPCAVELKRREDDDALSLLRMWRNHRVDVHVRRQSQGQERNRDDCGAWILDDADESDKPPERRGQVGLPDMGHSRWNDRRDLVADDQPMAWTELDQDLLPWAPPRTHASFNWDGSPWTGDPLAVLTDSELFPKAKSPRTGR